MGADREKGENIMSYETSNYAGDAEYSVRCTGDAVVGDEVRFERATFTGSFRNAKFSGFEQMCSCYEFIVL